MVGKEVVEGSSEISALQEGAGETVPLKPKGNFERSPHPFDPKIIRKQLDALRAKFGADTPAGHRCSNLIEQLQNLDGATEEQRKHLEKFISQSLAELAKLSSGPEQHAEEL